MRITPIFAARVGYRFRDGHADRPLRLRRRRDHLLQGGERGRRRDASTTTARRRASSAPPGVEVGRGTFRFGAEVGYTTVPDAIGLGGVSKVYGEDDLGGFHAIGKLIVAFGGK